MYGIGNSAFQNADQPIRWNEIKQDKDTIWAGPEYIS